MKSVLRARSFAALIAISGIAATAGLLGTADAQIVDDDAMLAPNAGLEFPKDITILGQADPNLRRPTAIVNGSIITQTEVDQRLALIVMANGGKIDEQEKQRLALQVLRNLIDEALQIQEAAANDIKIDPAEINQSFERVAANFKRSAADFDAYLRANGSSSLSMKRQIEGELAWSRLLRRNVQPFVNVSDEEVRSVVDRLKASQGTEEFRISEIYLSATPENAAQIRENARRILDQIRQGGSFVAYARQFSEASTAAVGGDLGWVRPAQLPDELAAATTQLQVGQIAGPIEMVGGMSILYLVDKRKVLTADPRDAVLGLKQLTVTFPPNTAPAQAQEKVRRFQEAAQRIQGCGGANEIAAELGAEVVDNDGIVVRDLPPALQSILVNLQVGQATPPFGSVTDGVRLLVVCGRDDPANANDPSFDQIMAQMEDDRINKRARIYLRDLRRDAVIDYN